MRPPEQVELRGREEQLRVPGHVPAQGVHEERRDRVLLQAVPQPAQGVARELEGGRGRLAGSL